jgi:hypothetical protein
LKRTDAHWQRRDRGRGGGLRFSHRLATISLVTALAASFGAAIASPAPAGASTAQAAGHSIARAPSSVRAALARALARGLAAHSVTRTSAAAQASAEFRVGTTYRANDSGGYYLEWNGVFKGQLRTTGSASTLTVYTTPTCATMGNVTLCAYMWEVNKSGNCLEYDGSNTAVIADTCESPRFSQWWLYDPATSPYANLKTLYSNGCEMFADSNSNGSLVNCNLYTSGDYLWKIYAHS